MFASGNVVHNLGRVEWGNPGGSTQAVAFNDSVKAKVLARDDAAVMAYRQIPGMDYAVPTPEHYLPLIYMLGASEDDAATVFNDHCELAAIAMTGFAFGL